MKKLYRKGTVHPSPPLISDHLAFLPAAILTLTAALTQEDREVLAYLISCSGSSAGTLTGNRKSTPKSSASAAASARGGGGGGSFKGGDHPPLFSCSCFGCYTSYWARWDASPKRQLIHEIIDAFEDWLVRSRTANNKGSRKERRRRGLTGSESDDLKRSELGSSRGESESAEAVNGSIAGRGEVCGDEDAGADDDDDVAGVDKGSVRKLVSLIGERIWNVWGQ